MTLLADSINRANSVDREAIRQALLSSTFSSHIMPYGPTQFIDGQNIGGRPLMTQVLNGDIKVILPVEYREAQPRFPIKA